MEEPPNPGGDGTGGDGASGDGGGRSGREVASQGGESGEEVLDELWPSRPSSAAANLAAIWVANPVTSERYTYGLGGLDLDPEIWEVRIHLDGVDNLERKIGRDDITYMNVVAMIETQGYSIRDSIYCTQSDGRVILVQNNAIIYELLEMFESTRVLPLSVKRRAAVVAKNQSNAGQRSGTTELGAVITYTPQVVYDLTPPPVFSVDTEGQVFTSQCTQQSTNIQKGKQTAVNDDDAIYAEEDDDGDGCIFFDMGEADFAAMEEIRRKEDEEIAEKIKEMRRKREDPMLHCEASEIKGEKTFVIRKMKLRHTCPTTTDSTRVSARWLAAKFESLFRSDPNTTIQTVIDSARQHFGVEVPKMMAYRAKWLAIDAVLGDHREQYVRLRDFAQTVVDTNPGSRVIVTTVTPAPSLDNPHPGPTFHGLFFCMNGAREGFLKGCRPFIGLDGCFIKLCTGAQILAATGGESGQFGHYTIMSGRQKGLLKAISTVLHQQLQKQLQSMLQGNSLLHNQVQGKLLQKVLQDNLLSHQEQLHNMMEKEDQHSKGPGLGATSTVVMLESMEKKDLQTTK
ncbi:hypothetical protein ACQ4PT_000882 [Festuca glaucescens]